MMRKRLFSLWLGAATTFGQIPAPAIPLSSVKGTVSDASTHEPVSGIQITAVGPTTPAPFRTDMMGHYEFNGLQPGVWHLYVKRENGYLPSERRVEVLKGQDLDVGDLPISKACVVAGRVINRAGEPVEDAIVSVSVNGYVNGRPVAISYHSAITNDLGRYRVSNLLPGLYYVKVEPKPRLLQKRRKGVLVEDDEQEPIIADIRTYYPSSAGIESATPIELRPGDQEEGIEITLLRAKTFCVTSSYVDRTGSGRSTITISELSPMTQSRVATGSIVPGDDFEVCGVPPGKYRMWSFQSNGDKTVNFASEIFDVVSRSIRLPTLEMRPSQQLLGKVTVENKKPSDPLPSPFHISLQVKDRLRLIGESTEAQVDADGNILIPSVVLDDYWLNIDAIPSGYYVKEAKLGEQDAMREPMHVGSGHLRIVLASDGASLSGQVIDDNSHPVARASVILAASPLPTKVAVGELLCTETDDLGQFTLSNMAPGSYRLLAFSALRTGQAGNPEFIRTQWIKASEMTLSAKETRFVSITALPAPIER